MPGASGTPSRRKRREREACKSAKKAVAPAVKPACSSRDWILKAASDRLAAARAMRFTAVISYESPSRLGPPLVYTTTSEVTLQRPDKLRVITPGDGPASEFYYDGKMMMAFEPAANLVAVADAPPTIDAALQAAYDAADLLSVHRRDRCRSLPGARRRLAARLLHRPIPRRRRHDDGHGGGCQQVGVRTDLDRGRRQAAAEGPRGVSRRSVAAAPRDGALNWKLDATVPADAFASSSAGAATRISFTRPDLKLPPGLKPPTQGKFTTTQAKPVKTQ